MPLNLKTINKQKVGPLRFKQLNGQYLLTNDIGEHCFLEPEEFDLFLSGRIDKAYLPKYEELQNKGFILDRLNFADLSRKYASKNKFLGQGTSLHIVVVTLRCDHNCVYCQAGSGSLKEKSLDMDVPIAKKVVERIFESPSRDITIEFQGGEPLINWNTVKFIIRYALKKNKELKKNLKFSVVSNLTFINEEIFNFLLENNINICTSLDGPEKLHNKCRLTLRDNNSYKNTVKWLKQLREEYKRRRCSFSSSALTTITRFSLLYPKEIVDEYVDLGLEGIHLRPVNPFGLSSQTWKRISYSSEDFINFYMATLDYIIDLNLKGKNFHERFALIFLTKILTEQGPGYLDIRSPCGAAIGQLAYNFNGQVYTCDEGRMLGRKGDHSFRLGNVEENSYKEFINNEITKAMCVSSCLDTLAGCSECIYKPYCGVCPLYNYILNRNIFDKSLFLCTVYKGIQDYLFEKLKDKRVRGIFNKWVGK